MGFCKNSIKVSFTEYDDFRKVEQSLRSGQTDVGFTMLPSSEDLITRKLRQDEFVVILSASFILKSPQLSWEEVTQYPMIIPPKTSTMMQPLHAHLQQYHQRLNIASEVETDVMIINSPWSRQFSPPSS
ncbi:MAG: LysR family transcriptional regulator substrate-binding protein [Limnothrix sp. RL_2_0]|nr:LysR family transcriptional regulator substrate-binding protein [Limnothrix sp. RL_2_0]